MLLAAFALLDDPTSVPSNGCFLLDVIGQTVVAATLMIPYVVVALTTTATSASTPAMIAVVASADGAMVLDCSMYLMADGGEGNEMQRLLVLIGQ